MWKRAILASGGLNATMQRKRYLLDAGEKGRNEQEKEKRKARQEERRTGERKEAQEARTRCLKPFQLRIEAGTLLTLPEL